jgi:hypothetical protein
MRLSALVAAAVLVAGPLLSQSFEFLRLDGLSYGSLPQRFPFGGGAVKISLVRQPVSQPALVVSRNDGWVSPSGGRGPGYPSVAGNTHGDLYLALVGDGPTPGGDGVGVELHFTKPVRLRWSCSETYGAFEYTHTSTDGSPWAGDFFLNSRAGLLEGIGTRDLTVTGDPDGLGDWWAKPFLEAFPYGTFSSDGVTCLKVVYETLWYQTGNGLDIEVSPMSLREYADVLVAQQVLTAGQGNALCQTFKQPAKAFRNYVAGLRRSKQISACQEEALLEFAP